MPLLTDENRFRKKLEDTNVYQRQNGVFNVELVDKTAPVQWFHKGEEIVPSPEKYELKTLEPGKYQLTIRNCQPNDEGEIKVNFYYFL